MNIYEWTRRVDAGDHPYLLDVVSAGFSETVNNKLNYHNEEHLHMCLSALRECFFPEKIPVIYALAIAWHDAVYVPGAPAGYNEELSCVKMTACERFYRLKAVAGGRLSANDDMRSVVKQIVSDCIRHTSIQYHLMENLAANSYPDSSLEYYSRICDADLSHLANPNYDGFVLSQAKLLLETYDSYYALSVGEFGGYVKDSVKFFDALTMRRSIYRTPQARTRYEHQARLNIGKYVEALCKNPIDVCRLLIGIASNLERL
jgi:predicted metal-dependent HD superfamily phosphohydrolase